MSTDLALSANFKQYSILCLPFAVLNISDRLIWVGFWIWGPYWLNDMDEVGTCLDAKVNFIIFQRTKIRKKAQVMVKRNQSSNFHVTLRSKVT